MSFDTKAIFQPPGIKNLMDYLPEYFFTPIPLGPIPAGAFPLGVGPASPANQPEWNPQVILSWPSAP